MAGTRNPSMVSALAKSSELTSGATFSFTRSLADDGGREVQPDAELLELNRHSVAVAAALHHGVGILAAGQEAGFLAVFGNQVRFGQALEQPLVLQRLDDAADAVLRVEEEQIQQVAEDDPSLIERRNGKLLCARAADPAVVETVGEERGAELLQRAAAHFREAHAQQHLVARDAFLLPQQVDDVFLLLDVAGGDFGGLVDDVLAAHGARDDDVFAVAVDVDRLTGEQRLHLRSAARSGRAAPRPRSA